MSDTRQPLHAMAIGDREAGHWWCSHGDEGFWRVVWDGKNWTCSGCSQMPFGRTARAAR